MQESCYWLLPNNVHNPAAYCSKKLTNIRNILDIYLKYIPQNGNKLNVYQPYMLYIYWTYIGYIKDICSKYMRYWLEKYCTYIKNILEIFETYIWYMLDMYLTLFVLHIYKCRKYINDMHNLNIGNEYMVKQITWFIIIRKTSKPISLKVILMKRYFVNSECIYLYIFFSSRLSSLSRRDSTQLN